MPFWQQHCNKNIPEEDAELIEGMQDIEVFADDVCVSVMVILWME